MFSFRASSTPKRCRNVFLSLPVLASGIAASFAISLRARITTLTITIWIYRRNARSDVSWIKIKNAIDNGSNKWFRLYFGCRPRDPDAASWFSRLKGIDRKLSIFSRRKRVVTTYAVVRAYFLPTENNRVIVEVTLLSVLTYRCSGGASSSRNKFPELVPIKQTM